MIAARRVRRDPRPRPGGATARGGVAMSTLALRPRAECRYDLVALGEVMLRLDPGDMRIATTRQFTAWEGGGEYNVARGLRRCFGLETAIVTALVDNPVGRLVEDLMLPGRRRPVAHPVGAVRRRRTRGAQRAQLHRARVRRPRRGRLLRSRAHRGLPAAPGHDRLGRDLRPAGSALAPLRRHLLRALRHDGRGRARGVRRGAAPRHDRLVRPQLPRVALEVDRRAAPRGGGEPRARCERRRRHRQRGGLPPGARIRARGRTTRSCSISILPPTAHSSRACRTPTRTSGVLAVPRCVRCTRRARTTGARSAASADELHESTMRRGLEIYDRVGGGDSFASGLIYGLLEGLDPARRSSSARRTARSR